MTTVRTSYVNMSREMITSLLPLALFDGQLAVSVLLLMNSRRPLIAIACLILSGGVVTYFAPITLHQQAATLWSLAWVPWLSTLTKVIDSSGSPASKYWKAAQDPTAVKVRPLRCKLLWSLDLIHNFRGINWNWQIECPPGPVAHSRARYVLLNFVRIVALWLAFDVLCSITALTWRPLLASSPVTSASIRHESWMQDALSKAIFCIMPLIQFKLVHLIISTVTVACGCTDSQV